MKKAVIIGIIIVVIILAKLFLFASKNKSPNQTLQNQNSAQSMIISSPSFNNNTKIPPKFTCDGGNINPELIIQNVPAETRSLALIVDDPDAVGGKTFTHWLVWNIDPKTEIIKQESVPMGVKEDLSFPSAEEGRNNTGKVGYLGPCPPDKKPHRYFFKLYALDFVMGPTEAFPKKENLEEMMKNHIIEKAELIGIYLRTN